MDASSRDAATTSWVVAEVEHSRIGIAADWVEEIRPWPTLGAIPRASPHLLGLTLVRGEPIAVVDLARFLDLPAREAHPDSEDRPHRVVVVATGGYRVGLALTRVVGVHRCASHALLPAELAQEGRLLEFALGEFDAEGGIVSVLDLERLLSEARVRGR